MSREMIFHLSLYWKLVFLYVRSLTHPMVKREQYIKQSKDIYFYRPEYYHMDTGLTPTKIPTLDLDNPTIMTIIQSGLNNILYDEYVHKNIFYLVFHDTFNVDYQKDYQILDSLLNSVDEKQIIIKEHPQAFGLPGPKNPLLKYEDKVFIDRRNFMVESVYASIDMEQKILITDGSGSVSMPKYLYNREPYVIFTYRIGTKEEMPAKERMSENLMNSYVQKNKIYVPSSINEFNEIMKTLVQ